MKDTIFKPKEEIRTLLRSDLITHDNISYSFIYTIVKNKVERSFVEHLEINDDFVCDSF